MVDSCRPARRRRVRSLVEFINDQPRAVAIIGDIASHLPPGMMIPSANSRGIIQWEGRREEVFFHMVGDSLLEMQEKQTALLESTVSSDEETFPEAMKYRREKSSGKTEKQHKRRPKGPTASSSGSISMDAVRRLPAACDRVILRHIGVDAEKQMGKPRTAQVFTPITETPAIGDADGGMSVKENEAPGDNPAFPARPDLPELQESGASNPKLERYFSCFNPPKVGDEGVVELVPGSGLLIRARDKSSALLRYRRNPVRLANDIFVAILGPKVISSTSARGKFEFSSNGRMTTSKPSVETYKPGVLADVAHFIHQHCPQSELNIVAVYNALSGNVTRKIRRMSGHYDRADRAVGKQPDKKKRRQVAAFDSEDSEENM